MTAAPFLSRRFGEYVLVAQLSEDALGIVFRAISSADERRFVRMRILRSDELSHEAVLCAVRENALRVPALRHESLVERQQLDVVEGIPFMTWDEAGGWTLDMMLSRVRALGIRIPVEYALLIAERIADALEHAHQTIVDGRRADHGVLWPGFVSIAFDASVRVGGFGIAEAVIPSLSGQRMTAEIAPYVAPEVRNGGRIDARSDVYSLGAILVELTTGRRPALELLSAELRATDPRSDELGAFLRRCLAPPEERFASAVDAHRALQQIVTGNPYSLYTANLALFLYKLLNPEGQSVAPSSNWESTNPVTVAALAEVAIEPEPPPLPATPRRRKSDTEAPPVEDAGAQASEPIEVRAPVAAFLPEPIDIAPVPEPIQEPAADPIETPSFGTQRAPLPYAWKGPAAALAAAAGLTVGVFLAASQLRATRPAPAQSRSAIATSPASPSVVSTVSSEPALPPPPERPEAFAAPAQPIALVAPAPAAGYRAAANRSTSARLAIPKVRLQSRQPAEDLRLRAALARIEADRVNASETAGELFGAGRHSEQEGERLLRQRDYDAAQLAFSRAARLFQQAQELTWEERVRQASLSSTQ